jgi:nucleoside-diphosphate-sugar epimerase
MGKTLLIIGGTKFIGPYIVRRLSALGHRVIIYHRGEHESSLPAEATHIRSHHAAMPVTFFEPALFFNKPDVVIHMIAMGEKDSRAAFDAFNGYAEKMVWLSSGDVYAAYGRFSHTEPGEAENDLLNENSPLRKRLYPYRNKSLSENDLNYYYEKIWVERIALENISLPGVVLRLPKVYGPESNNDLATVYRYRYQPQWRWTHGFVENVAEAIVIAALNPVANGQVFNVGEEYTPTIAERLSYLPDYSLAQDYSLKANFDQDIAYNTSKIRLQLGYKEIFSERESMKKTIQDYLSKN